MKTLACLLLIFTIAFTVSCNKDSSEDVFALQIIVKDSLGNTVPNITVGCWNLIAYDVININKNIYKSIRAASWIPYDLKERSEVSLNIYDLENRPIKRLINNQIQDAGHHVIVWNGMDSLNQQAPSTVYKFELTARDSQSKALLFSDHMYGYLLFPYDLGKTSSNGIFETDDRSLFPNLYNLPDIPVVDNQNITHGNIIIKDSVEIFLSDYSTYPYKTISYFKKIVKGTNNFDLIWGTSSVINNNIYNSTEPIYNGNLQFNKTSSLDWKLYQIYPNPFN